MGDRPTFTANGDAVCVMIRSVKSEQISLLLDTPLRKRSRVTLLLRSIGDQPAFLVEGAVRHCEEGGSGRFFYVVLVEIVSMKPVASEPAARQLFSRPTTDIIASQPGRSGEPIYNTIPAYQAMVTVVAALTSANPR